MRRRQFLAASAVGTAGATALTGGCGMLGSDADVIDLAGALAPWFRELDVPDEVFRAFAADHLRHHEMPKKITDSVARRFLMSTDFFQHGADPTRRLGYASYYDPYVSVCYNPLRAPA